MAHLLSEPEAMSRAEAGREVVDLCYRYDGETAADIISGRLQAYAIAASQMLGWPDTLALIQRLRCATDLIDHPRGQA